MTIHLSERDVLAANAIEGITSKLNEVVYIQKNAADKIMIVKESVAIFTSIPEYIMI